jgi:alpha-L-fucosidase
MQGMVTPYLYIPPDTPSMYMPIATNILVVNMPPLGCIPALLTLYGGKGLEYDSYGCLKALNAISKAHNKQLNDKVVALRKTYPHINIYYGDGYAVYKDILKNPKSYNVTAPLKACCGVGGAYNFNNKVTCGHAGLVDGKFVNLTMTLPLKPCTDEASVLSWDGIHTSNTFNRAAATAFLLGQHITPKGGLNCSPDFTFWDATS